MTLHVFSARISLADPDALNVTRQSGGAAGAPFAPSWAILTPALDARNKAAGARLRGADLEAEALETRAWTVYREAFRLEMRESYRRNRAAWERLLARERVVISCYCNIDPVVGDDARCHRTLLRTWILPALGAVDSGELAPTTKPEPQLTLDVRR